MIKLSKKEMVSSHPCLALSAPDMLNSYNSSNILCFLFILGQCLQFHFLFLKSFSSLIGQLLLGCDASFRGHCLQEAFPDLHPNGLDAPTAFCTHTSL